MENSRVSSFHLTVQTGILDISKLGSFEESEIILGGFAQCLSTQPGAVMMDQV